MAKPNSKCVRMSDEVMAIVEAREGEGFNQKFENLGVSNIDGGDSIVNI